MGMFDYLTFEDPLPDLPIKIVRTGTGRPQTKTLDCLLDDYIVRDGKLYLHKKEYRGTGEIEEVILAGRRMWEREVQVLVREWDEQILFHGDLYLTCCAANDGGWVRLVARFTEGNLVWVKKEDEL
jgi:hypothetical protein